MYPFPKSDLQPDYSEQACKLIGKLPHPRPRCPHLRFLSPSNKCF